MNNNISEKDGEKRTTFNPTVKPSVVRVFFPKKNREFPYLNDSFELKKGDRVFVDGKFAGIRGVVTDINYSFKIKLSEYKKVTGKADTDIKGSFFSLGTHIVTFERTALPFEKAKTWFTEKEDEEDTVTVLGNNDSKIGLSDMANANFSSAARIGAEEILSENGVVFIEIDGEEGKAIVEGSFRTHELNFRFRQGEILDACCDCFEAFACKHLAATAVTLKGILEALEKDFSEEFGKSGYFSAVSEQEFSLNALNGKKRFSLS